MAAEVDVVAAALLGVWDAARERATSRLSEAQLRTVIAVEQYDGINLRGLANQLGMLLSSASRLCDRLVAAGMLEREPGRLDRREISLHLTPVARAFLTDLRADRQQRLAEILAAMTPAGRAALLDGLREFDVVARSGRPSTPAPEPRPPGAGPPTPAPAAPTPAAAAPGADAPATPAGTGTDAGHRPAIRSTGGHHPENPMARTA